jgi:hypothetical protein
MIIFLVTAGGSDSSEQQPTGVYPHSLNNHAQYMHRALPDDGFHSDYSYVSTSLIDK